MSMEAKLMMIQDIEEQLQEDLTVAMMRRVKETLGNILEGYQVEHLRVDENGGTDDMLGAFLAAKKVEGRSPKTLKRYKFIMDKVIRFAGVPIGRIQVGHLRDYFGHEKDRGVSSRTLDGERSVISGCFGWLVKEELIRKNPCANMSVIKYTKKVKLPFSKTDIEMMKESAKTVRDRAIICFLLSTGARISEVCALNRDDINFQDLECKVLGKGNKERTVYLDNVASMMLQRYLKSRTDDSPALFVGKRRERLTTDGVRRMLNVIEARSGVENIHPHRFRRTLATGLINHGMAIQEVANILGHENINTTMQYVYVEKQNVKNNYRRYA